jgi:hypothetical protein
VERRPGFGLAATESAERKHGNNLEARNPRHHGEVSPAAIVLPLASEWIEGEWTPDWKINFATYQTLGLRSIGVEAVPSVERAYCRARQRSLRNRITKSQVGLAEQNTCSDCTLCPRGTAAGRLSECSVLVCIRTPVRNPQELPLVGELGDTCV